jgi:hypothetical protein
MTDQVIKFINGELEITPYCFMKQNNLTAKVDATALFENNETTNE